MRGRRVVSLRALNRATLARQLLLTRRPIRPVDAIARLAGLQAEDVESPCIALWSRIDRFDFDQLERALQASRVVRASLMRGTLHIVSAADYLCWRQALQPVLLGAFRGFFPRDAKSADLGRVLEAARALLVEKPRSRAELAELLAPIAPGNDPGALAFAARVALPLVQLPPSGAWRRRSHPRYTLAEDWLGKPLGPADEGLRSLVVRYLRAFGPATRQDVESWSGLSGLQEVIDELGPQLSRFQDEMDRPLLDLPRAARPSQHSVAPPRLLARADNLLLAHQDRRRVVADEHRRLVLPQGARMVTSFLVDGFVAGTWRVERSKRRVVLVLTPFDSLPSTAKNDLIQEASRLLTATEHQAESASVTISSPQT